jgi:toxin ParE1/3/4
MRLRYSGDARRQIVAIGDYIARDDASAARRVIGRIRQAARLLASFPGIGRTGRAAGTREWFLGDVPYRIVYERRGNEVVILAVFHTARRRDGDEPAN